MSDRSRLSVQRPGHEARIKAGTFQIVQRQRAGTRGRVEGRTGRWSVAGRRVRRPPDLGMRPVPRREDRHRTVTLVESQGVCIGGLEASGECFVQDAVTRDLRVNDCVWVSYAPDPHRKGPSRAAEVIEVPASAHSRECPMQ